MKTIFIALRALIVAAGYFFLWAWVALRVRVYDQRLGISLPSSAESLGIPLMAAGTALALACVAVFVVQGKGTPAPFDAPRKFVAIGPYRYVRNPMYIGAWALLAGFGLYEGSLSILVFSLAWLLVAHLFVIIYEEPTLRSKFGATYGDYCRTVRRWIPRIP